MRCQLSVSGCGGALHPPGKILRFVIHSLAAVAV